MDDYLGSDTPVMGIADLLDPEVLNPKMLSLLNISQAQLDANIASLPKKGDYVLALTGEKLATWFLRGVTPYYSQDSLLKQMDAYDMQLVAEDQIATPAIFTHVWTHLPDAGETWIGFKLYKVLEDRPKYFWRGRYPDGWMGERASVLINSNYGRPIVIKLSAPEYTLPNVITISKDGKLFKQLTLSDPNEVVLDFGSSRAASSLIEFRASKAVKPKDIGLNRDTRKLGARVTLDNSVEKNK